MRMTNCMNKKFKTVVYAVDNNYANYAYVSAFSLLINNKNIEVYFLVNDLFSEDNKKLLESLSDINDSKIIVKKIDLEKKDYKLPPHVTYETIFRLFIASYVESEKCLYLDVDTIVDGRIDELFELDFEDNYIIGRRNAMILLHCSNEIAKKYYEIPNFSQYINAGVLMMNLRKIREDNLEKQFWEEIQRPCMLAEADQAILNKCCLNNIGFFELKFNICKDDLKCAEIHTEKQIDDAITDARIFHYVDAKPWVWINKWKADLWWKYAKETTLYSILSLNLVEKSLSPNFHNVGALENVTYFLEYISRHNIIVYGAGVNGHRLYNILLDRLVMPICYAVTSGADGYVGDCEIKNIDELDKYKESALIVIAVGEKYENEIVENVKQKGFSYVIAYDSYLSSYENARGIVYRNS